ncbi:MAG: UDP-N-acetylmuramate--L-alanine ligase [Rhabdochlamydiaceae bacterium]|nr:UDP-N-acetylmuramate--L-alanine ligase [Candidatus Amphrikana amoebophyrae]
MTDSYHFIGIGGIGMSSLAHILLQKKCEVSGSDIKEGSVISGLKQEGAKISLSHSKDQFDSNQTVVYSTAIDCDNLELRLAKKMGCKILHRSELLNQLTVNQKPIMVVGTHGKTTTSALLTHILKGCGADPSYVIGGVVESLKSHGAFGLGEYFILEGDESDGSFLKTSPFGAIITNLEDDHLDYWKDHSSLLEAFSIFVNQFKLSAPVIWCGDDKELCRLNPPGKSYGFSDGVDYQVKNVDSSSFELNGEKFPLKVAGLHNALNSSAAIAMALQLGFDKQMIKSSLSSFLGVSRRLEYLGNFDGVDYYDDYAHHPTEIKAAYSALESISNQRRIWLLFQPHRYSRVKALMDQFCSCLKQIPNLVLFPIYAAGESKDIQVQEELRRQLDRANHIDRDFANTFLSQFAKRGDIVLTMGAGDISSVGRSLETK